ncbi:hypothetical protein H6G33_05705 [Calothrix sp. FACHB-1219]|uniref:hypothetical protein n=1 Tax=unclassified Calothrix TaxID=2619626 RepID=UPI001683536F|nr:MULTISPECIES: hypothetical protein [unclassified Calothrix]MBD2205115.1 hypothetical protein [Calothrix sp. FACHB-168]MBD2216521.1 hypothetical protein [Calothrix sp. FACHB-1219]
MSINSPLKDTEITKKNPHNLEFEITLFIARLKNGVWLAGIPSWLFGITDRSFAAFADGYISALEVFQLFTASFFFVSWLYLRPETDLQNIDGYLCPTQNNRFELKKRHMISQEYILPVPYLCQIYHLLNLKHLETIHKFSLNNLRVINISSFQKTDGGGTIKFQTVLDSPLNALRIWRQPIVEVDLILHTPYTIELSIPVYNGKRITVMFYALPLSQREHHLFIEIYSDLDWPKPILQVLLHFASCLTLFEDLPYLRNLYEKNIERLFHLSLASNHQTMLLFKRFVELYGSSTKTPKLLEGSK